MTLRRAEVSGHAWERFVTRWEGPRPPCFRRALQEIMAEAHEEDLGYGQVLRLLKNRMLPARYFITEHWRFVTNEEVTVVLTIERPYHRGKVKNQKKKRGQKS